MPDYSKLSIRFVNYGLNLAHDPSVLPFGKYAQLTNLVSDFEGNLRSRDGLSRLHTAAITGSPSILGFRRFNDSVSGTAQYMVRAGTELYNSSSATEPFTFGSRLSFGHSSTYGSLIPYRPSISADVWAYLGDATKMVKTDGTNVHPIGYTRPTGLLTLVQQTTGGNLTLTGTYDYRFSFYATSTGAESRYNSGGDLNVVLTGSNNRIDVRIPTATVETGVNRARVYRKGGTITTWRLLTTVAYDGSATVDVQDTTSDASIQGNALLDEDSDKPFTTTNASGTDVAGTALPYFTDPVFGYVLAVGDPLNPGYLYWTNKFDPDRQDPDNRVEVSSPQDPLQNVVVFNGTPYVFSQEAVWELVVGLGSSTFTPIKTPARRGLITPQAVTVGDRIYYIAKDGIYATSGGGSVSITDDELRPLFEGYTVNGYAPVDLTQTSKLRLAYFQNELWFMYQGTDALVHFMVYDMFYGRWRAVDVNPTITTIYTDEAGTTRLLMGTSDGFLLRHTGTADHTTPITCTLKTGFITLGTPLIHKEWGQVVLDVDPQGIAVTAKAYTTKGGTLVATGSSSAASRDKIYLNLDRAFAEDLQLEVSWTSASAIPIIYGYELFYRPEEPQIRHYHVVGVTHGIHGWQILRSAYITYRSNGAVNFKVEVYNDDGTITTNTYSLPSTAEAGGAAGKIKRFVPLNAIKGKLFGYSLEAAASGTIFRFYPEESEIHVKPWITSLGYRPVNPFAMGGTQPDAGGFAQAAGPSGSPTTGGGGGGAAPGGLGGGTGLGGFEFLGGGGNPTAPPNNTESLDPNLSNRYNEEDLSGGYSSAGVRATPSQRTL